MKILSITIPFRSSPLKLPSRRFFHIPVFIGLLVVVSCAKADFLDYREKLILSVEWGAKSGKFGLAIPAEGEIVGPRTFTIGDDGYIHIFDSIKRNIKVFSREGVFQGSVGNGLPGYSFVVYKGYYYLLDGENVYQYTLSGMPVETYQIAPALTLHEGYGQWMRIDGYGDLYVRAQGKSYRICEGIGRKTRVLSGDAQIKSERRGTSNNAGTRWFTLVKESVKRFKIRIHDKNGDFVNEFPIETTDAFGSIFLLDQDEKGIIHLEVQRIGADGVIRLEIRRYRGDGSLVQIMELPNNYYTIVYKKSFVDKQGSVYQLQTAKSGVKIVKWEK